MEWWGVFGQNVSTTFLGALFAFLLSFWLYRHQKKSDDTVYLKYSVARFVNMMGALYNFKEQHIINRISEIQRIEGSVEEVLMDQIYPDKDSTFTVRYISKKISAASFKASLDIEKLNFLAKHDPNVIMLLEDACNCYESITSIAEDCNFYNDRMMQKPSHEDFAMIVSCNKGLASQVDSAIYLTELASKVLIKAAKKYYDDKNLKSFELTDDKYEALRPESIESYEGQEWFSN